MKKVFKIITICILSILAVLTIIIAYQVIHLRLYVSNEKINLYELTSKEKEEDFRFLTGYVRECYPYGNAVEELKGLDQILGLDKQYIKRAGETKSNLEFLNLFIEYTHRLGQAGHWGIEWLGVDHYSPGFSLMFGIPKDAFCKTDYWQQLGQKLPLYVHSDMGIKYADGKYVLSEDYRLHGVNIPEGSVIEMINDTGTDEYVKSLQTTQVLRFDVIENKVYTDDLFRTNPGANREAWEVTFVLPDNHKHTGMVKKLDGYKNAHITKTSTGSNVICRELDEQIGYIRIFSFQKEYMASDHSTIQDFMKASCGKYEKLIIDVRGNNGGEPASWMDNIIQPLLKHSVSYDRVTAVKKSYFGRMNLRYAYYRLTASNHLLDRDINHISNISKIQYEGLDNREWTVYKITRELSPENSFPFDGQVYVLADNDTLSAADSFVTAVRETGMGKVVGTNTLGWGNVFMQPNICALPNSGLMLRMDVEMPLNADGTVNAIYGVKPDVNLAPSTYPTPYPANFRKETLLNDPWILWVIHDQ